MLELLLKWDGGWSGRTPAFFSLVTRNALLFYSSFDCRRSKWPIQTPQPRSGGLPRRIRSLPRARSVMAPLSVAYSETMDFSEAQAAIASCWAGESRLRSPLISGMSAGLARFSIRLIEPLLEELGRRAQRPEPGRSGAPCRPVPVP